MSKRPEPSIETQEPHWIEWATGVVSGLLVLGLIGWVGYDAVTKEQAPPDFTIEAKPAERTSGGYRIRFDITNTSTTTAAAVNVRGEARKADGTVEGAETTFDYVPAGSSASGALIFSQDPTGLEVQIRAAGYTEP